MRSHLKYVLVMVGVILLASRSAQTESRGV